MKFVQLIEYDMGKIFLKKSYTKCGRETIPRPSSKNQKWGYLWINSLKFCTVWFYCIPTWGYHNTLKLSYKPLPCTSFKLFFKKSKMKSGTSHSASFLPWFLKKNIFLVIFYYLTKFYCLVFFTSWDIGQCCIAIFFNQVLASWNFKLNLSF